MYVISLTQIIYICKNTLKKINASVKNSLNINTYFACYDSCTYFDIFVLA